MINIDINGISEENKLLLICGLAIAHCFIGFIAALVAQQKGYNFRRWLFWGLIGGTPTLIIAVLSKPKSDRV